MGATVFFCGLRTAFSTGEADWLNDTKSDWKCVRSELFRFRILPQNLSALRGCSKQSIKRFSGYFFSRVNFMFRTAGISGGGGGGGERHWCFRDMFTLEDRRAVKEGTEEFNLSHYGGVILFHFYFFRGRSGLWLHRSLTTPATVSSRPARLEPRLRIINRHNKARSQRKRPPKKNTLPSGPGCFPSEHIFKILN